jgi:hypothetical protein
MQGELNILHSPLRRTIIFCPNTPFYVCHPGYGHKYDIHPLYRGCYFLGHFRGYFRGQNRPFWGKIRVKIERILNLLFRGF